MRIKIENVIFSNWKVQKTTFCNISKIAIYNTTIKYNMIREEKFDREKIPPHPLLENYKFRLSIFGEQNCLHYVQIA